MKRPGICVWFWTAGLLTLAALAVPVAWAGAGLSSPLEGFVQTNGVRLQYLDWGGSGPALILLHGLADNAHAFDDLAPAFTDHFHVIAYSRRGSGNSDVEGPYDVRTLTEDLRGLMDALRIDKARLVGWSAGGDEVTYMAATYPQRVDRIVYLDSGYDWSDAQFREAVKALPLGFFDPPASAMASLNAFRSYQKSAFYPGLHDMGRIEASLREKVVIQSDGSVKYRTPKSVVDALYDALWSNGSRPYAQVLCPALALYAEHLYDWHIADASRRNQLMAYERKYWSAFQEESIGRVRRELPNVQIAHVPGAHGSFILTSRSQVASTMRRFLSGNQ